MRTGYKAVVEGRYEGYFETWEEIAECGHLHRSWNAAEKCGTKLWAYNKKTGEGNALWHDFAIHYEDGWRAEP